jgi:catechol 2,3-dioxygenase-like lactoylglutathione lyase family enzyme
MSIRNVLASVAVRDLNRAVVWYEKLLGAAPLRPTPDVAEWTSEGGGWLQVYESAERAGMGSFTLAVNDLETEAGRLDRLDIDTSQRTSSDRVKTIMFTDPDGNHIAVAEAVDSAMSR